MLYAITRDKDVRGVRLAGSPEEARRALSVSGLVSVAPISEQEITEYVRVVDDFNLCDGLIVASHFVRETEAVITSDRVIRDSGVPTIWE